jgi:hypothetical protein
MGRYFFIGMLVFLSGCVSVGRDRPGMDGLNAARRQPLTAISRVRTGMDLAQVSDLMRDRLVTGYRRAGDGVYEAVETAQPYQSTRRATDTGTYEIYFYFTQVYRADGMVSQEELTPLIFLDQKLVGIGYESLENIGGR